MNILNKIRYQNTGPHSHVTSHFALGIHALERLNQTHLNTNEVYVNQLPDQKVAPTLQTQTSQQAPAYDQKSTVLLPLDKYQINPNTIYQQQQPPPPQQPSQQQIYQTPGLIYNTLNQIPQQIQNPKTRPNQFVFQQQQQPQFIYQPQPQQFLLPQQQQAPQQVLYQQSQPQQSNFYQQQLPQQQQQEQPQILYQQEQPQSQEILYQQQSILPLIQQQFQQKQTPVQSAERGFEDNSQPIFDPQLETSSPHFQANPTSVPAQPQDGPHEIPQQIGDSSNLLQVNQHGENVVSDNQQIAKLEADIASGASNEADQYNEELAGSQEAEFESPIVVGEEAFARNNNKDHGTVIVQQKTIFHAAQQYLPPQKQINLEILSDSHNNGQYLKEVITNGNTNTKLVNGHTNNKN